MPRKGRIEKVSLKTKDTYELEFAIDAESELRALNILADVFGENIKQIPLSEFAKRDSLIFITHSFTIEELSDENYRRLLENKKVILIIKDELSVERAAKLLKVCIPVETALKRLMIYVWSEIVTVLKGKHDKKAKIEICTKINELYLGELLKLLEEDLSSTKREGLFVNDGNILFEIINNSENFADFKQKLAPYTTPKTVWEQVNIMLKSPTKYSHISGQLSKLKELRDMAAHHHIILQKDLKNAEKYSEHVLSIIGNVRNDYYEKLSKSIQALTKTMEESFRKFPLEAINKVVSENTAILSNTLNSVIPKMVEISQIKKTLTVLNEYAKQIDWNAFYNEIKSNSSEMKEVLKRFDNNDANNVIKEMQEENRRGK
jgi:hypothetical protein